MRCFCAVPCWDPMAANKDERPALSPADLAAYQAADSKAGRDAGAHVRLSLWCEARGLTAERLKHLSLAVLYDPANALARGLMGLVAYRDKWERPDAVGQQNSKRSGPSGDRQGIPRPPRPNTRHARTRR